MHTLLRTKFDSSPLRTSDNVRLDDINNNFEELKRRIEDAEIYKREKRNEMIQKLDKATQDLQRDIAFTVGQVNSGKLILEEVGDNVIKDFRVILRSLSYISIAYFTNL